MRQVTVSRGPIKRAPGSMRAKRSCLSLYQKAPDFEVDLDKFETLAVGRLNVLRWIERQRGLQKPMYRASGTQPSDIKNKDLNDILRENKMTNPENDLLAHFIMRLAFCFDDEKRRWLVAQEMALFQARFTVATSIERNAVIEALWGGEHELKFLAKKDMCIHALNGCSPIPTFHKDVTLGSEERLLPYAQIRMSEVWRMVARRQVLVRGGFAFVPRHLFSQLVSGRFRSSLSQGLARAKASLGKMRSDGECMREVNKVAYIIRSLPSLSSSPAYKSAAVAGSVRAADVTAMARTHFPVCMRHSLDMLRTKRHAKHGSRMQLGLFLKGVGLPLSESLAFWKRFDEKFDKAHAYSVRHNYGKEGKRTDYSPYSCQKIINTTPGSEDHCGCPFKRMTNTQLATYLISKCKLSPTKVAETLALKEGNHYQLACRSVFALTNRPKLDAFKVAIDQIESAWTHPNEYFDLSYTLWNASKVAADSSTEQTPDTGEVKIHGRFKIENGKITRRRRHTASMSVTPSKAAKSDAVMEDASASQKQSEAATGMSQSEMEAMFADDIEMDF